MKLLVLPDVHAPHHDKRAWAAMVDWATNWKPDTIIILGDFADFHNISSHLRRPDGVLRLHDEIVNVCARLDELDKLGAEKKIFIEGNHEFRLERYLCDRAPELYELTNVGDLFELQSRGWRWVPYRQHTKIHGVYFTHDVGRAGINALRSSQQAYGASLVIGHVHRIETRWFRNVNGATMQAHSFGWLGDDKYADYANKAIKAQWHHGFGIGVVEDGRIALRAMPIVRGVVQGAA